MIKDDCTSKLSVSTPVSAVQWSNLMRIGIDNECSNDNDIHAISDERYRWVHDMEIRNRQVCIQIYGTIDWISMVR